MCFNLRNGFKWNQFIRSIKFYEKKKTKKIDRTKQSILTKNCSLTYFLFSGREKDKSLNEKKKIKYSDQSVEIKIKETVLH